MPKSSVLFLLFFVFILGCKSASQSHPLVGIWERDIEKTVHELKRPEDSYLKEYELVKEAIRCEETGECLRTVLEYTDNEAITTLYSQNGEKVSRESAQYRLIASNDEYTIITEYPALNISEEVPVMRKGNSLSFELSYKGFTWKEYWRLQKAPAK